MKKHGCTVFDTFGDTFGEFWNPGFGIYFTLFLLFILIYT